MSIHAAIDNLSVGLGARFMPKFFREGYQSEDISEHLKSTTLVFPELSTEGDYELSAETLAGQLNAAFRLTQWAGDTHPTIIYHHGASETPFDYGFKRIFPLHKINIPVNLFLVRAPFHRNIKDFQQGMRNLNNVAAMLAVSVHIMEHLTGVIRNKSSGMILVCGTSLGGFITNLHHIHFNSADFYIPLLAGLEMSDVYLRSHYSRAVADEAKENPASIEAVLNFKKDFAAVNNTNVYPLLALHDQLVRFEPQKASYGSCLVETINKGHTTGALSYALLRNHILKPLTL